MLAFIGGLLAWFMQKNNEPGKAKAMLYTGIGLTVIYAAAIASSFIFAGSPAASGTIFYASLDDKNSWRIYRMDPDGKNSGRFTACDNKSLYFNVYPSWSDKTRQMTCYSNRDGNFEVYRLDADGGNQTNLTLCNFADQQAEISPDGKQVVFVSNRDGNNEIYCMDIDGSNIKRLTFSKPADERPRWSPDGALIVFNTDRDGTHEIYLMNADGGNQLRLTNNKTGDETPVWTSEKIQAPARPEIPPVRILFVGSKVTTANKSYNYSDNITFVKYTAERDGNVDMIRVYSAKAGNVKVAIYDHNGKDDMPLSKLYACDEAVPCQANQWNNIYIKPLTIHKGVAYWLAFNSDTNGIVMIGSGQDKMLRGKAVFEGFTFPDTPPAGMSVFKSNLSIGCWGLAEPDPDVEPASSPEND